MEPTFLFFQGFKAGLQIAMPVGSLTILCVQRSLTNRWIIGVVTGVAIALADSLYATIAGIALSSVSTIITDYEHIFTFLTFSVITFLGISTLRASTPDKLQKAQQNTSILRTFVGTFMLTLASPMTIILFASLFGRMAAEGYFNNYVDIPFVSAGVSTGAALWFIMLSTLVHSVRKRFSAENIAQISFVSGIGLLGFAGWQLYKFISMFV